MPKRADGMVRAFGMSGMQMMTQLAQVERETGLDLGVTQKISPSRALEDYGQFEADLRAEAARMSELYEVFYCLENSIRRLVSNAMFDKYGAQWWNEKHVTEEIKRECEARRNKELKAGFTPRSTNQIDYSTFGELASIITSNWDVFEPMFTDKLAVQKITQDLNLLRGPIAHCCPTDELEKKRLSIIVQSWFKSLA